MTLYILHGAIVPIIVTAWTIVTFSSRSYGHKVLPLNNNMGYLQYSTLLYIFHDATYPLQFGEGILKRQVYSEV